MRDDSRIDRPWEPEPQGEPVRRVTGEHPAVRIGWSVGTKVVAGLIVAAVLGLGAAVAAKWVEIDELHSADTQLGIRIEIVEDNSEDTYKVVVKHMDPATVMEERNRIRSERARKQKP